MNKTKIEWVKNPDGSQGYSCNFLRGRCPVDCWYCYMKPMYIRFPWLLNETGRNGAFVMDEFEEIKRLKKPAGIFLCSTYEIFHPQTNYKVGDTGTPARDLIFKAITDNPQHRFYILTKFPENIDRPMPNNVWLGVTVTDNGDMLKTWRLGRKSARIKFVSIEPILEEIDPYMLHYSCDWMIVGRLTGYGGRYDPKREWIKKLIDKAWERKIPIFLKDNLNWPEKIQGFPILKEVRDEDNFRNKRI